MNEMNFICSKLKIFLMLTSNFFIVYVKSNQSYKSRELNSETVLNQQSNTNCLICLVSSWWFQGNLIILNVGLFLQKPFSDPVTSVQCWHVYCATCWLSQLAADSCCPQCKTTTSIKGLRRVLFWTKILNLN